MATYDVWDKRTPVNGVPAERVMDSLGHPEGLVVIARHENGKAFAVQPWMPGTSDPIGYSDVDPVGQYLLEHFATPPAPEVVYPAQATLTTDRDTITADGADAAVVTYQYGRDATFPAEDPVTFDVNGHQVQEQLVDGRAAIEVVASAPGPVTVTCAGLTVRIDAQEAPV